MGSVFWILILMINLLGCGMMGIDKWKAQHQNRRIPEKTLFAVAFAGGAVGAWVGMRMFRHKTKHRQFAWGLPALAIIQWSAVIYLLGKGVIS